MNIAQRFFRIVFTIPIVIALAAGVSGCGGGTSGTGTRTYEGDVSGSSGEKIANLTITLEQTGDSTITDTAGHFVLLSEATEEVTLLLDGANVHTSVSVPNVPVESTKTWVTILLEADSNAAEVTQFSAKAHFVGLCEAYFADGDPMLQTRTLEQGTVCSLQVSVLGDGLPSGNVPIMLQRSACGDHAGWEDYQAAATAVGAGRGKAEIHFPFYDSVRSCRYRVLIPYGIPGSDALGLYIYTLTKQGKE